jgi:hypothetical protein
MGLRIALSSVEKYNSLKINQLIKKNDLFLWKNVVQNSLISC